jgi:hypothetical protein
MFPLSMTIVTISSAYQQSGLNTGQKIDFFYRSRTFVGMENTLRYYSISSRAL